MLSQSQIACTDIPILHLSRKRKANLREHISEICRIEQVEKRANDAVASAACWIVRIYNNSDKSF